MELTTTTRSKIRPMVGLGILIGAVLIAYYPALHGDFIWDDQSYIVTNTTLSNAAGLWQIWFQPGSTPQYYPLTFTSFWVEYQLWGATAPGYHSVNIALHLLCVVLLFIILKKLIIPGIWWTVFLFALHPVHVASVAWIAERKNVLSTLFFLLSTMWYFRFARFPGFSAPAQSLPEKQVRTSLLDSSAMSYGLSFTFFVCAVLSKTVTLILPLILLLNHWWLSKKVTIRTVGVLIPFLLVSLIAGMITIEVESHQSISPGHIDRPVNSGEHILLAGRAVCFYLGKLVWPVDLDHIYPKWKVHPPEWWHLGFTFCLVLLLLSLWFFRQRIGKGPLSALLYFLCCLVPVLGFFDFDYQVYSYVADHFVYLASIGLIALIGSGITAIHQRMTIPTRVIVPAMVTGIIVFFGLKVTSQCHLYRNQNVFWMSQLKSDPQGWLPNYNLGTLRLLENDYTAATHYLKQSLEQKPDYFKTHNNLAHALEKLGNPNAALEHYTIAAQLLPDNAEIRYNRAILLYRMGRKNQARTQLQQVITLKPDFADAHYKLGLYYLQEGDLEQATVHLSAMLKINPNQTDAHYSLGYIRYTQNRKNEALIHFRKALVLAPQNQQILGQLAWILATDSEARIRNGSQALEYAQRACTSTNFSEPAPLDTLAAAYAELGNFERAVKTGQQARALAEQRKQHELVKAIEHRLEYYLSDRPFRDK